MSLRNECVQSLLGVQQRREKNTKNLQDTPHVLVPGRINKITSSNRVTCNYAHDGSSIAHILKLSCHTGNMQLKCPNDKSSSP